MTTYQDLMNQAQALMAQADQVRKQEQASVIAEIKAKMLEYGLTVADLGGVVGSKANKSKSSTPAKFRGPNGELWAGGAGRKPEWVRELLAQGGDIEKFRI